MTAQTPNLDTMLAKFSVEHWHDEDEVRFIVRGRGLFHIHPRDNGPVIAIECEAGDLIRVPRGTWHWFDLCGDRHIRAIRLFQDKAGLDAALHRQRRRQGLSAPMPGSLLHPGPDGVELKPDRRRPAGHRGHDHAARLRPPNIVRLRPRSSCGVPRAPMERSRGSGRRRPAQRRARDRVARALAAARGVTTPAGWRRTSTG